MLVSKNYIDSNDYVDETVVDFYSEMSELNENDVEERLSSYTESSDKRDDDN